MSKTTSPVGFRFDLAIKATMFVGIAIVASWLLVGSLSIVAVLLLIMLGVLFFKRVMVEDDGTPATMD